MKKKQKFYDSKLKPVLKEIYYKNFKKNGQIKWNIKKGSLVAGLFLFCIKKGEYFNNKFLTRKDWIELQKRQAGLEIEELLLRLSLKTIEKRKFGKISNKELKKQKENKYIINPKKINVEFIINHDIKKNKIYIILNQNMLQKIRESNLGKKEKK